eukprot:jgi/Tetstr1/436791/TSEL_025571.t1
MSLFDEVNRPLDKNSTESLVDFLYRKWEAIEAVRGRHAAAVDDQSSDDTDTGDELTLEEEEMLLSGVDDVMGVGEDPVGEDGMDIDAPAWPPAGVEPAMRA